MTEQEFYQKIREMEAIKRMWWDDNTTIPDSRESGRGQSYPASELVEKTFKKSATAMDMLGGGAWLLEHGFKSEGRMLLSSCVIFRWMWSGCIGDRERRICVSCKVTADDETSWSAALVENGGFETKYCDGNSPMAALDELLRKYELTSEGEWH